MIKVVLFDFGGVLTAGGTSGCVQRFIGAVYGIDPELINADRDLMLKARSGKVSEQEFFAEMNRRHPEGPRLNRDNYLAQADIFVRSEPVYALAADLRDRGLQTAILSNIYDFVGEKLRADGYYDGFDPVILSCTEHVAKPHQEIYDRTVAKLGVTPQEIIFVDDNEYCLEPARNMGMHIVQAVTPEQIVADVKKIVKDQNGLMI